MWGCTETAQRMPIPTAQNKGYISCKDQEKLLIIKQFNINILNIYKRTFVKQSLF